MDDAKGGNAELEIQFGWWPEDFPDKKSEPGTSAVFRSDDSYELLVDCSIGAPPSGQAEPVTLRGTIVDRVGLTSHTAAKILIASAKEVTAGMKCGKAITFPDPPESHEGLK
ncbi:hypothetical protein [Streptomyces sp. NRRL S-920]|uniref:hypothetical protein n=1 Tax=Streptomyces sp. NRRL S-920 TaxID=1463921 RepID=UPI00131D58C1|nr:hypothetical protein [Streptomyces sp. NRRL S-920]